MPNRTLLKARLVLIGCLVLIAVALATCAAPAPTETSEEPAAVHWTYEGEEGPEHWGELSPAFALCSTGQAQTPIDIAGAALQNAPDVTFDYQAAPLDILNNGHTIQVKSDGQSLIEVRGTRYSLVQFHFHTPSEHTVEGELFAMELHLVHQDAGGKLAVVGVLIREGAENPAFTPIVGNLPPSAGEELILEDIDYNPTDLLPDNLLAYEYMGSLTTPPCSEGVSWFVLTTPIELSAEQIAALETIMGENNRPLQPLNDRTLVEDSGPD